MSRQGLLGPYQQWVAVVYREILNIPEIFEDLPQMDAMNAIYSCIIQAGVEGIELTTSGQDDDPFIPFNLDRTKLHHGPEFGKALGLVHDMFRPYVPANYRESPELSYISLLRVFMTEMIHAFMRGKNLIYLVEIPDPDEFGPGMPPEIIVPLRNLFSTMEPVYPEAVAPRVTISKENLSHFQEIMAGDLFRKYTASQGLLDNSAETIKRALSAVSETSRILRLNNKKLLKSKRIATSILPITSKLIDTVFGALPGKIAEASAKILTRWLSLDRRLVIYSMNKPLGYFMRKRFEEIIRKKTISNSDLNTILDQFVEENLSQPREEEKDGKEKKTR